EKQFNIKLVGHLDPIILDDEEQNKIYALVKHVLKSYHSEYHFHDFRIKRNNGEREIHFDVVVPTEVKETDQELHYKITSDIYRKYNEYPIYIKFSIDITCYFIMKHIYRKYNEYPIYIKFDRDYILDEANKNKR